jgi:hypothetical protein
LRTVQQQIAEFQLLERQLAQVLQRLQTAVLVPHEDGCRCLDSDTPEEQDSFQHLFPLSGKGNTMRPSTFEPLTILSPSPSSETNGPGDTRCGCGCGCGPALIQLTLPQEVLRHTGDPESVQPTQS